MSFVGPFPTEDTILRLRQRVLLAKLVGAAADLDTALDSPPTTTPAVYVVTDERGGPVKYTGPVVIQNVDVQIKVVIFVRNVREERLGVGARKLADQVIEQVRDALIGWVPCDAMSALHFAAGRDDRYKGGFYAGQQVFRTEYRIQKGCPE